MKTPKLCPNCGQPLPAGTLEGLCPSCLLNVGAGAESVPDSAPGLGPHGTVVAASPEVPPRNSPDIGHEFGRYRLLRRLGHGGMGVVYEAEETDSGRRVALKVINQKLNSPSDRARFLREGRLAASINHPNCVYVYGTEEIEGTPVIAMEFVSGGTLQQRLSRQGPLPVGRAVDAILQVVDGLEAAHALGILHRDIKPSNCFEDEHGTVKIGDFGLSISTMAHLETNLTEAGTMVGTPAFCSPEQLRGEELNTRSDMYAVGVTLFQLLTGRLPFEGQTMAQVIANTIEKRPASPVELRPDIPTGLVRVILRCLAKHPSERFPNYAELRRALQPYSSTAPTPATLGLRFLAGLLDLLVLNVVSQAILFLVVGDPFAMMDRLARNPWHGASVVLPCFALLILYYALTEWRWGATMGKALCGLRVLRADRNYPSLFQALGRSTLFVVVPVLPSWVWIATTGDPLAMAEKSGRMFALSFSGYLLLALLFVSLRRRNGFAALHDLATRTRVVSRAAWEQRPALVLFEPQPAGVESKPMVGPYHGLQSLGSSGDAEWVEGYDLRLLRRVLLRRVPPGTPPLAASFRQVSRAGRLRWLTGRRDPGENWDAFEGVGGQPLLKLAEHPQPWAQVRFWLYDLATELGAAAHDGSLPGVLEPDRVWITRDGRAKLLDYPAPGCLGMCAPVEVASAGTMPTPAADPKAFLGRIAVVALAGRARDAQRVQALELGSASGVPGAADSGDVAPRVVVPGILPIHARRLLETLPGLADPAAVAEALRPLLRRPCEVTRLRRAMMVTACVALPLFLGLAVALGLSFMQRWQQQNPALIELSSVLNTWQAKKLPFVPADTLPSDRLIGLFIAAHYRGVITNAETWSSSIARALIPPKARQFAERSLDQYATATPAELQEAEKRLGPIAQQMRAQARPSIQTMGPFLFWLGLLLYVAVPAVITALLFRGGLVLWITGVTFVRRDGRLASRGRLLWRSLLTWSPVAGAAALAAAVAPANPVTSAWLSVLLLVILTGGSLGLPHRGLPDRLAGTWPVPR